LRQADPSGPQKGSTLDYTPECRLAERRKTMQIGAVSKRAGLSADAIRFYERNALLPHPPRTAGGFRRYAESDVEVLAFIRRTQGLGFKLREIRSLLELRRDRMRACGSVRRQLKEKLEDVKQKVAELQELERELSLALRSCNRQLRKGSAQCPMLKPGNGSKQDRSE
jgi:DNA-binding transcriptional MerR regulator